MLRICTYRTQYFQNGFRNPFDGAATLEELQAALRAGQSRLQPGLQYDGRRPWCVARRRQRERAEERLLLPDLWHRCAMRWGHSLAAVPRSSEFDGTSMLSVDLSSAIPEIDPDLEPISGRCRWSCQTRNSTSPLLSSITLLMTALPYEAHAGIADIDVSAHEDVESTLAGGTLSLRAETPNGPVALLTEQGLTAVSDDCNLYLDEGDASHCAQLRARGLIPGHPVSVLVATYDAGMQHTGEVTVLPVSSGGTVILQIRAESPGYRHFGFTVFNEVTHAACRSGERQFTVCAPCPSTTSWRWRPPTRR